MRAALMGGSFLYSYQLKKETVTLTGKPYPGMKFCYQRLARSIRRTIILFRLLQPNIIAAFGRIDIVVNQRKITDIFFYGIAENFFQHGGFADNASRDSDAGGIQIILPAEVYYKIGKLFSRPGKNAAGLFVPVVCKLFNRRDNRGCLLYTSRCV